jgi:hypothetical protein
MTMPAHGKSSVANVQKKDSFFYHALNRSFCRVVHKIAPRPRRKKLSGKTFKEAESFGDRDMVCRVFAAECYDLAKKFADAGQLKVSLQYAKLAARLLNMSLRPKRLQDLEEIKKALAKLKEKKVGLENSSRQ